MIGKLSGNIDSFGPNHLILDVNGVGYIVSASARTLSRIGQVGDPASLLIETQVREDSITLYGFAEASEQDWFKLLTSVQGVGAKAGLAILSVCPPEDLAVAIAAQDKEAVRRADGVGPKLAARIVSELKDKAAKISMDQSLSTKSVDAPVDNFVNQNSSASSFDDDALSALINLGYARSDAYQAIMRAKSTANDNLEDLIKEALKELSA